MPRHGVFHSQVGPCPRCLALWLGSLASAEAGGFPPFTEESNTRGINYVVQSSPQSSGLYGFGVACADLDADGDDDVIALGALDGRIGLFTNNGSGFFSDVGLTSGLPILSAASALAVADLTGDGLPELIVTQVHHAVRVFQNTGALHFVPHALDGAFGSPTTSKAVSLADIDRDGDLDFYLATYTIPNAPSLLERNRLLRNDGGVLVDLAPALTMNRPARTFLGIFSDLDKDGDQDLYVSNDRGHLAPFFAANQLWLNDGSGHFTDVSAGNAAAVACFSMGVACGDFDGNGTADFLVTNIPAPNAPVYGVNPLLLGNGASGFTRAETLWGVEDLNTGWGALFADLDHNGYLDLFVNHQGSPNALWLNDGTPPALLVLNAGGASGVPSQWNYSTAAADLDRDGDLDLVSLGLGSKLLLYLNHAGDAGQSVRVRLEGAAQNRDAIGARIELVVGTRTLLREVQAGGVGYLGQSSLEAHFGLGGASGGATMATVYFPDGAVRELDALNPGDYLVVHPSLLGDGNRDGHLDALDRASLDECILIGAAPRPGSPCARHDFNGDLLLDAHDAPLFEAALAHARADLDNDALVNARDLVLLLDAWGIPKVTPHAADLDDDGVISCEDLARLLQEWDAR